MKKVLLLLMVLIAVLGVTACALIHTHTGSGEMTVVKEATCYEEGQAYMSCAECGEEVIAITIPKVAHTEETIPAVMPTCTETGLAEGIKCSVCDKILYHQAVLPTIAHTETRIPAIEPTCTETGFTEGSYCSGCDTILVKPTVVDIRHNFVNCVCTVCGEKYVSEGLVFTSNGNGTCSLTGMGTCEDKEVGIPSISPDGDVVTKVASYAFDYNYLITSVVIPDTVTSIGNSAFYGCTSLASITIPGSVTSIGDSAFELCKSLTSITIPASVASIGQYAFRGCYALNSITIDEANQKYKSVDGNLYTKDGEILILYALAKDEVSFSIPNTVTSIGDYAFAVSHLESIIIPDNVTTIGSYAFSNCTKLTNIDIPSNVTSIGENAFACCYAITNISLPDSLTSIKNHAFYYCRSLQSITIPDSVTSISTEAFSRCISLQNINFNGTIEQWNAIIKSGSYNSSTGNYTIYCSDGEIAKDGTVTYYETEKHYVRDGNYIYFGEYPQTIKADDVTMTETQDSRGYYLGSDGSYYAMVTASPCGSSYTFSTGSTVTSGSVYYFKVEPIRWRILSEENGEALILCDSIIANVAYQPDYTYDSSTGEYYTTANGAPEGTYANNYKYSNVRNWLNSTFYETAFSSLESSLILTTEVDNSAKSTNPYGNETCYNSGVNDYACENTSDKVFLLSQSEATNTNYGFASYSTYDTARRMLTSDYSRATGAYMSTSSSYYGNGMWWMRSPCDSYSSSARNVFDDGHAYCLSYDSVYCTREGVVPALRIIL